MSFPLFLLSVFFLSLSFSRRFDRCAKGSLIRGSSLRGVLGNADPFQHFVCRGCGQRQSGTAKSQTSWTQIFRLLCIAIFLLPSLQQFVHFIPFHNTHPSFSYRRRGRCITLLQFLAKVGCLPFRCFLDSQRLEHQFFLPLLHSLDLLLQFFKAIFEKGYGKTTPLLEACCPLSLAYQYGSLFFCQCPTSAFTECPK